MGWRMRRSFKIAPGMRVNLSKSGLSTCAKLGPVTVNSRRGTTIRVAKGLSYHVDQGSRAPAPAVGSPRHARGCLFRAVRALVIVVVAVVIVALIASIV